MWPLFFVLYVAAGLALVPWLLSQGPWGILGSLAYSLLGAICLVDALKT